MRLIAVRPMARPMSARRSRGPSTAPGAAGWKRTIAKPDAEIMNRPRPQASIRYSGQWRFTALVKARDTTPRGGQGVRAPFSGWRCPMPHDSSNGSKEASMDDQPLRGQRALVTGASSGIGEGVARAFGAAGAAVVVNYAGNADAAARVVNEVKATGSDALAIRADVSKEADVEAMFAEMQRAWGGIDILVSNAGLQRDAAVTEMTLEHWNTVIGVNLTGAFLCGRAAARAMIRQGVRAQISRAGEVHADHRVPQLQRHLGDGGVAL